MKRFLYILIACSVISCADFLKEDPPTSLTDVYGTEAELELGIRGILRSFEGENMFTGNMLENLMSTSGLIHWGSTSSRLGDERWDCCIRNINYSSMSLNISMYESLYKAVNNCNILLKNLPSSPVDEAYKKEIEAEAKFYRAVIYFSLVRIYGNVPLLTDGIIYATDYKPDGRTSYNKVYEQIVKDLTDAWEGMRDKDRVMEVTGTQGRPHKWAAKSMLSSVYLWIASILTVPSDENFYNPDIPGHAPDFTELGIQSKEDAWTLAYNTAKDVIDNSPYRLAKNYQDLFRWEKGYVDFYGKDCWNLDERIFVLQSTGTNRTNYSAIRSLPRYPEGTQSTGTQTRYGNWRPSRFLFQKWCEKTGGQRGTGDVAEIYVGSDDPRFDITFIHTSYVQCHNSTVSNIYPNLVAIESATLYASMPYFKKYYTKDYTGAQNEADFYFMRLAEIYYIAAEAAARLGKEDEAYDIIENIHYRARGADVGIPKWTKGEFVGEELINNIIWDKIFELSGEGHEYYEVRRNGSRWFSEQILQPKNAFMDLRTNDAKRTAYYGKGFKYETDPQKLRASLLCEFPKEELALNSSLSSADKNDFSWE